MDLAQTLRSGCVGAFSGDAQLKAAFGVANRGDASLLLQLCAPDVNYSRRGMTYRFLPEAFKTLITAPSTFPDRFGSDTLYVFHHLVSAQRMAKRLRELARAERHLAQQIGGERFAAFIGRPPLDPKESLKELFERYADPTCIRMNVWGYASILGEQNTNREVMRHLKGGAERAFELLEHFVPAYVLDQERRCKRIIAVYDFFQQPVERVYARSAP